jgi:hypothetical protein
MDAQVAPEAEVVPERRRSKAALVGLGLVVAGFVISAALSATGKLETVRSDAAPPAGVVVAALVVCGAFIGAVVVGIVALVRIRRARGELTGRIAAWIAVIVSALILAAGVAGAIASPSAAMTKDDFEEGRFWTEDEDPTVRQRFVDGGYEVLIRSNEQPSFSRYFLDEQTTPTLTFASTATIVDDAGDVTYVGVSCWGSPSLGYLAGVGSDGTVGILRVFSDRRPESLFEDHGTPKIGIGTTTRLSIECRGGGASPTTIVLRANDAEIARAQDAEGLDSFVGVGLWYGAGSPGAVIRWTDSSATS